MGKGAQTRETILDEALRAASRDGLGGLSIAGLADAVGMSKSGLFAHFRSKEQLQLEALQRVADLFVEHVVRPALKSPRGEPRLRTLFDRWLAWDRDAFPGGCVIQAASAEFDDVPGPVRDFLVDTQRDLKDTLGNMVRAGVEHGAFRKDLDVEGFAFELLGLVQAYRHHARLLHDPRAETLARAALERLFNHARA
ncbi:MAG: TetR/AcrR family transcriptional regulator [Deltaproteobacteria bacterium]|nr:TetR/AcrR family transcriptional regulator [Deltaproteobacteria bacterium]